MGGLRCLYSGVVDAEVGARRGDESSRGGEAGRG